MKITSKENLKGYLEEILDHPTDENETLPYQEILLGVRFEKKISSRRETRLLRSI